MGSNGLCVADKSTDELLHEFQNSGHQAAFEEIVRRYAGMVYTVCLQVTRDVHDAEDATQAAFLTLALRAKTAENIKYLGPWLQKVARRLSLDIMRAKKRRKRREERRGEMVRRLQPDRDPRNGMDRAEMADIVRDELGKLPSKYRLPLILHYFGGLRPDEVARELGYKPSTLGVRLHRGRKMLAESLEARGITVSNGMLASILAMVVHQGIGDNVIAQTSLAAAGLTTNGELPAAIITARVLSLTRHAASAVIWAKTKVAVAILAAAATALAAGVQVVRTVAPFELNLQKLNPLNWIRPMLRSLISPPQFSSIESASSQAIVTVADESRDTSLAWLGAQPAEQVVSSITFDSTVWTDGSAAISLSEPESSALDHSQLSISTGSASMSLAQAGQYSEPPPVPIALAPIALAPTPSAPARPQPIASGFTIDATTRSITHTTGIQRFDQLVLDSQIASFENYRVSGSAQLFARNLIVGDAGRATFDQDGGRVQIASNLMVGRQRGSAGTIHLRSGTLLATNEQIGIRGTGQVQQSGGKNTAVAVDLGVEPGSNGVYAISGGEVAVTQRFNVGVDGSGQLDQSGGEIRVQNDEQAAVLSVAVNPGSNGQVLLSGGSLAVDELRIGEAGSGRLRQDGGELSARWLHVGSSPGADGAVALEDGRFQVLEHGGISVGTGGSGSLKVGSDTTNFEIVEQPPQNGSELTVRAKPTARGTLSGHGEIALTGRVEQNGRIVADGGGWPKELDLSTASRITNSIDNPIVNGTNGWYGRRGGKLVLPPIEVDSDGTYTWGEDPNDPVLDLVNSVRLDLRGVKQPGKAIISLLATDHILIPQYPPDELFISVWSLDRKGLEFGESSLLIRYDDVGIQGVGGDELDVRLWTFTSDWELAALSFLDPTLNILGAEVGGDLRLFAVSIPEHGLGGSLSIPEPTGVVAVGLLAGAALLRRKRR